VLDKENTLDVTNMDLRSIRSRKNTMNSSKYFYGNKLPGFVAVPVNPFQIKR
jgi:hypothetical protein